LHHLQVLNPDTAVIPPAHRPACNCTASRSPVCPAQPNDDSAAFSAHLLAAVAQLTNLKQLNLTNITLDSVDSGDSGPQPGDAAAHELSHFSALTSCSQLESLTLAYKKQRMRDEEADYYPPAIQPFPRGAAVHLFPPGRQLTALTGDGGFNTRGARAVGHVVAVVVAAA
jgi:hypothetical protein